MQRFWTTAQLLARGRTERQLRAAMASGEVSPVRRGLVAVRGTSQPLIRAARVGGVLTGASAAAELGLWTPPDPVPGAPQPTSPEDEVPQRLQVAAARRDHRLRDPDDPTRALVERPDVVVHRVDLARLVMARRTGIAPTLMLLEHAFLTLDPVWALAILDSALHERHLLDADLGALAALLPPRLRAVIDSADGRAESGLESIVRYRLRQAGFRVRIIVGVRGLGSVDLLVEERLIVECDGKRWHTKDEAFANDRRRDLVAATERYRTLRLTWYRVLFRWDEVEAAVFTILAGR